MNQPRLVPVHEPRAPEGIVLVLHGGASRRDNPMVSPTQLSVLRMIPVARRLARAGRGRLAVYRVLNSTRGWDATHTPVDDAHWAVDQARIRLRRDLPVALVGHSLGGRAAILAATERSVTTVVALNPWVHESDGDVDLAGRAVLVVHGDRDRIASPRRAEAAARRLARRTSVDFVTVTGAKHAMLRRHRTFDSISTAFVRRRLLEDRKTSASPSFSSRTV